MAAVNQEKNPMKKPLVATIAGAVALVSIGAGSLASAMDKAITLRVDGQAQEVHVWGSTVEDALAAHSLELTPRDEVSPSTDTPIADGSIVDVRFARPVTVIVDGELKEFWTTATTLGQALAEIGLHDTATRLSVARTSPLGREGMTLAAVTPKEVNLTIGKDSMTVRSTASDVLSLLIENGVIIDSDDRVSPSVVTPLTAGMTVTFHQVEVKEESGEQTIDFQTVTTEDATLAKGTERVSVEGQQGTRHVVWEVVYVDGVEESRAVLREDVVSAPVDREVTVGTKASAGGSAGNTTYTGSHTDWMAAAGIAASDYSAVEILVQRESSWNPNAVNPTSGACGLTQALPCSKLGPNWNDPVVALAWGDSYVKGRYGSWQAALAHSYANGWY